MVVLKGKGWTDIIEGDHPADVQAAIEKEVAKRIDADYKHIDKKTELRSAYEQLVLARFMEAGGYQRHLRQFRRRTREQVELVADAVERFFPPGTRFSRPRGGFALWLELPDPAFDSVKLFHAARKEGIGMAPGPLFSARGGYRHALRLSCTAPWDADQARRLARLGELAGQQLLRP